ncbi:putative immunity protein [Microbacterium sp. cf332]|uniref:putative immunity protein n=1 Tax=Microbacterium sp. cf332 TaxID=1761804 RepID=UPI00088293CC|nr:hypothetical protein [Microbacterium sp. cf332]SDQ48965.1 hypothetical protein SAMN04487847_1597 [Microbacterium sp. cf332]
MASPQSLTEHDRRLVAAWAADCADHVLPLFEAAAPDDDRPRDAIARARAYARGELDSAGEIRRRFVAGRAATTASDAAAIAAARSAAQAAGVAHMGAHALGAAGYAAAAAELAQPGALRDEVARQIERMPPDVRSALALLPRVGEHPSGPLAAGGLLARGAVGTAIRSLQAAIGSTDPEA